MPKLFYQTLLTDLRARQGETEAVLDHAIAWHKARRSEDPGVRHQAESVLVNAVRTFNLGEAKRNERLNPDPDPPLPAELAGS